MVLLHQLSSVIYLAVLCIIYFISNVSNTLRHQFESGKTQKTALRQLSVAIENLNNNHSGLRNVLFKITSTYIQIKN
jgi:hypothetical protein